MLRRSAVRAMRGSPPHAWTPADACAAKRPSWPPACVPWASGRVPGPENRPPLRRDARESGPSTAVLKGCSRARFGATVLLPELLRIAERLPRGRQALEMGPGGGNRPAAGQADGLE